MLPHLLHEQVFCRLKSNQCVRMAQMFDEQPLTVSGLCSQDVYASRERRIPRKLDGRLTTALQRRALASLHYKSYVQDYQEEQHEVVE